MAGPFSGFAARMLSGSVLNEVLKHVPAPAREAILEVRDYVAENGKLPKPTLLRRTPLEPMASSPARGREKGYSELVNVMLGELGPSDHALMVNLFKGVLRGGTLRCNVAVCDVHAGEITGANVVAGHVHGGVIDRANIVLGDVHAGEVRHVNVLVGDVHGGFVQCNFLVGHVYGGRVQARHMLGDVHGGDAQVQHKH